MKQRIIVMLAALSALSVATAQAPAPATAEKPPMGFFVTSVNMGDGGNLGGLAGADAHCQKLAEAVGSKRTWHAYLSTQAKGGQPAINARDRIGAGPWYNVNGHLMATNVDDLHYNNASLNRLYSLAETGAVLMSRSLGDPIGQHDALTGSNLDGTAIAGDEDATCNNWTSNDAGKAMLGHLDRLNFSTIGGSWNSAHLSQGCSPKALEATAGDGLFYCFAID